MHCKNSKVFPNLLFICTLFLGPAAFSADADDLTTMLHEFLAGAGDVAAHERFWADELVYTSSNGTRTSKAEIMAGFGKSADLASAEPESVFTGEDIQIQIYGTTAVVAFRLIATPADNAEESAVQYYFNTGTFLKRDGTWKVVAWQATRIPTP